MDQYRAVDGRNTLVPSYLFVALPPDTSIDVLLENIQALTHYRIHNDDLVLRLAPYQQTERCRAMRYVYAQELESVRHDYEHHSLLQYNDARDAAGVWLRQEREIIVDSEREFRGILCCGQPSRWRR